MKPIETRQPEATSPSTTTSTTPVLHGQFTGGITSTTVVHTGTPSNGSTVETNTEYRADYTDQVGEYVIGLGTESSQPPNYYSSTSAQNPTTA